MKPEITGRPTTPPTRRKPPHLQIVPNPAQDAGAPRPEEPGPDREASFGQIRSRARQMAKLLRALGRIARVDGPVVIRGETGVGKELVAQALHRLGRGVAQPFVAVNCGAFPSGLVESELFGHERGAFTGATTRRIGAFEEAGAGTLLLDEIGELPLQLQSRLLRALEQRTVRRVGGHKDIPVRARVLCATHRDLPAEVAAGRFREDLYHRLAVFPIRVPPLRERLEDLPLLAAQLLAEIAPARTPKLSAGALGRLTAHHWPGNVRELRNVLTNANLHVSEGVVEAQHLQIGPVTAINEAPSSMTRRPTLAEQERLLILDALARNNGNRAATARELAIARSTLRHKLASYGRAKGGVKRR